LNNYHKDWEGNVKLLQRFLWGTLTDFRNLITGARKNNQEEIVFLEWFSFELHHWRTKVRYPSQQNGHDNKYDCEFFSLIALPKGNDYGGIGHTKISNEVNDIINGEENGLKWENYFKEVVESILNGNAPTSEFWSAQNIDGFQNHLDSNFDVIELISIFCLSTDSRYVRKLGININE